MFEQSTDRTHSLRSPRHSGLAQRMRLALLPAYVPGAVLVVYAVALITLSTRLADGSLSPASTRGWLAGTSVIAGALYLAGMYGSRSGGNRRTLLWTIGCALLARGLVCASPPLLETDFYRYLWDGAVTSSGANPYRHTPEAVILDLVPGADGAALHALAQASGDVVSSVNHPHLTTVYPPLAQGVFAVSSFIDPFGTGGWRLLLFTFDCLTSFLLFRWLRARCLPTHYLAWYITNPLLLSEVYAALHMDVLVLPFLVGAALLAARRRRFAAALVCVLGSGIKIWPALLVPLFLPPDPRRWRKLIPAYIALAATALVLWAPVWSVAQGSDSGFVAYGESWQNNDGFFRLGIWTSEEILTWLSLPPWHSHAVMRIFVGCTVLVILAWNVNLARRPRWDVSRSLLVIVGAIFLLSPTQFPWYWLWCLPLLAVRPNFALLLYVALLPLYNLQDSGAWVYWVQHLPVWMLLTMGAIRGRRPPSSGELASSSGPEQAGQTHA